MGVQALRTEGMNSGECPALFGHVSNRLGALIASQSVRIPTTCLGSRKQCVARRRASREILSLYIGAGYDAPRVTRNEQLLLGRDDP